MICICLFIGAMGKSAQVPLHVWLPDSMEGPTPISALIHAATMVTAGIFMVARMSPLFELSDTALSFVTIIGAITALFMAFLGIVQNDIKRVVAYSTLSQLGYMTVALGVSAYSAAIFHLMTHAFFKALLFLGAGSVIIALHHEQDLRKMGGLRKYMPITYITAVIGSLALARHPAVRRLLLEGRDHRGGAAVARSPGTASRYFAVMAGVFVTAFYSFRMLFLAFHGDRALPPRPCGRRTHAAHDADAHDASSTAGTEPDAHGHAGGPPHESPWVVTVPLILLAIPSVYAGWMYIEPMLFGDCFGDSIVVREPHAVAGRAEGGMARRDAVHPARPHAARRSGSRWRASPRRSTCYLINPALPARIAARCRARSTRCSTTSTTSTSFNDWFFAGGARGGRALRVQRRRPARSSTASSSTARRRVVGWASALIAPASSPVTSITTRSR